MISKEKIEIKSKTKGLLVSEWTIRSIPNGNADRGLIFQAILVNETSADLFDLEYDLRYFDSSGKFLGRDAAMEFEVDDIESNEDKSIEINITAPSSVSKCIFTAKAKRVNFIKEYDLLLFGLAIVIASALFYYR